MFIYFCVIIPLSFFSYISEYEYITSFYIIEGFCGIIFFK